jgi:type IV pilus assembly protein PilZ
VVELRRHQRATIDIPVQFVAKGSTDAFQGQARDISVGGMFVQTPSPLAFGADVVVSLTLPGQKTPFSLPAVVRWSRTGEGMGLQFGLIGARETHAITELTKAT